MRWGQWKLVVNERGQKRPGLFDLSQNLGEKNNLAKKHPQKVEQMLAALKDWEKEMASTKTPQPETPPKEK